MKRCLFLCAAITLAGCTAPGDRTTLPPLPEKVSALPYADLLTRARAVATQATEASMVDRWTELEETATSLERIAKYLPKADDVPAKHKDTLGEYSADLGKAAEELRKAAVARDAKKTTAVLTKINRKVREMRLAD
jgi:hypothetical protein